MESLWKRVLEEAESSAVGRWAGTEVALDVVVWAWAIAVFWVWNAPYLWLDLSHWPAMLYRFKLQRQSVSVADVVRCVQRVLFNQIVVSLPVILVASPALRWAGVHAGAAVPSVATILAHLACFVLVEEVFFYYTHRLLHAWRYASIHKIHHEFRAPIGIASEYAHWFEYIFSNLAPLLLGPAVMGSHMSVVLLWVTIAVIGTSNHHCGYRFPWLVGLQAPQFHDYHHFSFRWNLGLLGILDYVHGTDRGFRQYCERVKEGPIDNASFFN
jgi:sterol desaturase/sphingolipid hydroxylase (fatty acid hydroxylase superfamily)